MSWKFGKLIAVEEVAYERDEMYMAVGKDLKLLGKKGGLFMESSCTKTRGDSLWNPRVQKTRRDSLWNPRGQKQEQAVFPGFEWRISTAATFDRREYLWDYSLSGFVTCFVRTRSTRSQFRYSYLVLFYKVEEVFTT